MKPHRVLITGAGQRVGAAMARRFSSAGFAVLVHHRNSGAAAQDLVAALSATGPACSAVGADLGTTAGCQQLAEAAIAWAGADPIDVLINNASAYTPCPFGQIRAEDMDHMYALHARAPLLLAQALAPALARSGLPGGGLVLNLADIGAERPAPGFLPYAVSKAALVMLTRALALEMAPAVRVNAIAPGTVQAPADLPADQLARIAASIPLHRLGDPSAIASAALFLATQAPYCTGVVLPVDGGRSVAGPLALDLPTAP